METSSKINYLSKKRSNFITAFLIFVISFLIKIPFLAIIKKDPTFIMPIIDCLEFDAWSWHILNGKILWTELNNHPPLYAYFLALIYKIVGYQPVIVVIVQYIMSSVIAVIIFFVVKKYFNKTTAIISCIFFSTYWFFIYINSFLYSENLSLFLNMILIYVLLFLKDTKKKYFFSGMILGLSAICRPQILLFSFFILIWFFIRKIPLRNVFKYYFLLILGIMLFVCPVIYQNFRISGEMVMRTQVGANIYMGNNPEYRGTNLYVEIGKEWDDFISRPHNAFKRNVSESESNKYFLNETFKIIRQNPYAWIKLTLAKAFNVWTGREYLRTEDVYVFNHYIAKTPFGLVNTKLLFLFAIIGIFISLRKLKNLSLFYLLLIAQIPIIFFPIKTRYLMPGMPVIIIFASYAFYSLYDSFKNKQYSNVVTIVCIIGAMNLLSVYNPLLVHPPDVSETFYAIAKNYSREQKHDEAIKYFLATIRLNPGNDSAYNDVGVILMNLDRCDEAVIYFKKAMEIDQNAAYPKLNYDLCVEKIGAKLY